MKMLKRLQRGISLLEVMLSLSIIAIILVMATRYFFSAQTSNNINAATQQISLLKSNLNTYKATHANYTGVVTKDVVTPGDPDWDSANGRLSNVWGGTITVAANSDPSMYDITFSGIPNEAACDTLAGRFGPIGSAPGSTCTANGSSYDLVVTGPSKR